MTLQETMETVKNQVGNLRDQILNGEDAVQMESKRKLRDLSVRARAVKDQSVDAMKDNPWLYAAGALGVGICALGVVLFLRRSKSR